MNYKTASLTAAISTFSTMSAMAHPGDHSAGSLQTISHFLFSPWHILGLLLAVACTIALLFTAIKTNKSG